MGIKVVKVDEAYTSKNCSLCGEAHEGGHVKRGLFKCPRMWKVINADLNGAINILHIPESRRTADGGQLPVRGNGLKTQPVVYRWTNGAGWVRLAPTSYEVMRVNYPALTDGALGFPVVFTTHLHFPFRVFTYPRPVPLVKARAMFTDSNRGCT